MSNWALSLAGGVLIGVASTLLLWRNGRVAGVSGMVSGVLFQVRGDTAWRAAFLAGLVAAGGLYLGLVPDAFVPREEFPRTALVAAGLLVGFGTRMGSGCTSGHGVCGLGRRSPRSLVAVFTFMVTAVMTTYLVRHVWSGI
ncbi:YeeE/YedE family protein [Pseudomonas sp. TCU-HL1]|uniref:YeeE/YedE family protein n=1 Tax=Pseudomonas sp. TCU-HL1 TaxID=1856685 RepID=UPI00083D8E05|nr:YeeE/YedE family protein [Pseudomonas sp. TCU-HL1]AOE86757.1 hypothetical protein THL1_4209 [Pseudomonas sp. TCU-HL1]